MDIFTEDGVEYTICTGCGRQIEAGTAEETDTGDALCDECFRESNDMGYDLLED